MVIDFSPADAQLIKKQAAAIHISAEDYVRNLSLKAVHNAEYLSMLDKSDEQLRQGKVVRKSMEELETMERDAPSHLPNSETIAALEAAERGEDMYGPFYTVEELMEALNADD